MYFQRQKETILSINNLPYMSCDSGGVSGGGCCLVKVGGIDTEMYRTGHPHACSINLTTFCCRSCRGARREQERCAPFYWRWLCRVWRGLFPHWSAVRRARFSSAKRQARNVVSPLSRSKVGFHRTVRTPLIYHELFGCYVPSLWTLRTVRNDCSCFYQ